MPTETDSKQYNIPLDSLINGRALLINKCSSCHNLYLPTQYTKQEWLPIIDKMQKRAKIDNSQKEIITSYLGLSCKK
jgi:hypothetical protein